MINALRSSYSPVWSAPRPRRRRQCRRNQCRWTPILSNTPISASTGALPAPRRNAGGIRRSALSRAPPPPNWPPTEVPVPMKVTCCLRRLRRPGRFGRPSSTRGTGGATTCRHIRQPASAMMWACGQLLRRNGVGHHQNHGFPDPVCSQSDCWIDTSASVQWVAIRQIDRCCPAPLTLSLRLAPGNIKRPIRASFCGRWPA